MPLIIPTLDQLRTNVLLQLRARIPGADVYLRKSLVRIIAFTIAGATHLQWRSLLWMVKQLFIDSAETPYLDRRLTPYGLQRLGATAAAGNVTFTGTPGIPIPGGTVLQTSDGESLYATQAPDTIAGGGAVTIPVGSLTFGSIGNADAGASLTLSVAIAGVQPKAVVDSNGLSGGTDTESDENFRARGIARIRQPPQGGAATDYLAWAKGVAGVTRVWVYPLNRGAGTVDVTFVMDGRTNNVPLSGDLTAVLNAILAVRPVTADVQVFTPAADALSITIHSMVPNDAATKAAVTAACAAMARQVAAGVALIGDGVSASNPGGILYLEQIDAAISSVGTLAHYDLVAPSADVNFALGHIPATPTVTFT